MVIATLEGPRRPNPHPHPIPTPHPHPKPHSHPHPHARPHPHPRPRPRRPFWEAMRLVCEQQLSAAQGTQALPSL